MTKMARTMMLHITHESGIGLLAVPNTLLVPQATQTHQKVLVHNDVSPGNGVPGNGAAPCDGQLPVWAAGNKRDALAAEDTGKLRAACQVAVNREGSNNLVILEASQHQNDARLLRRFEAHIGTGARVGSKNLVLEIVLHIVDVIEAA